MSSQQMKATFSAYRVATETYASVVVSSVVNKLFAKHAELKLCHPFGTLMGPSAFLETCLDPLSQAMPDLERRDMILLYGITPECGLQQDRSCSTQSALMRSAATAASVSPST